MNMAVSDNNDNGNVVLNLTECVSNLIRYSHNVQVLSERILLPAVSGADHLAAGT